MSTPKKKPEPVVQSGTLITPPSSAPAVLTGPVMTPAAEAFLKEAKGERQVPSRVPIISIDHKTGAFVLPSAEVVLEVSGYPVYYYQTRRYYKKPYQPGAQGTPPDCWSPDLLKPDSSSLEKQSEVCAACPMSQFGTGRDGKSQMCAVFTWVFLLNPDFGSPPLGALVAPPSSIRALLGTRFHQGYFATAAARHQVYEIVWSTFRLRRPDERSPHCVLEPVMGAACTAVDQVKKIVAIRNEFLEAFEFMRGMTPSATASGEE